MQWIISIISIISIYITFTGGKFIILIIMK